MSKAKKLLLPLIGLTALSAASLNANATCTVTGHVIRVSAFTTSAVVYLRTGALINFYYNFTITDPEVRQAANHALTSGQRTQITGNATSCPTTGDSRSGGTATTVRVQL